MPNYSKAEVSLVRYLFLIRQAWTIVRLAARFGT
jgi:hypothetical protein